MADSFIRYNPGYEIIIALVDKVDGRFDPAAFLPYTLIETGNLGIDSFDEMAGQYSVIELNCAMKAFVAQYIMKKFAPELLLYLDSDILIFNTFNDVEQQMLNYNILITPHFISPYPDTNLLPKERDTLRSGIYNAGFFAIKKGECANLFLSWWANHMRTECYYNFAEGMGVDQIWFNLIPQLFNGISIYNHTGANIAYWNLHERQIELNEEQYIVNKKDPLLFLHISGYSFQQPEILSRHQNRFDLNNLPVLKSILLNYKLAVIKNGYETFSAMECVYAVKKKKSLGIMKMINRLIKPLGIKVAEI
ncbi:MAG: hypothetical protein Q8K64_12035 [Sediminibacterium sp.]|nr:hypothetical protein [Sediminibacterium sp.]